ncbi:hypothetical protein HYDPIDRAFT_187848 [Hydnomerulius pinastri MD-312]|uniref:PH domain-containing protein n=1 Tax=Hydnomerulius pinastri MD-312 TaxID=994086 RepID=A0A0C9WF54_9AGAM|nr:hypothetical protein HYDPIDRAFT_187848 [Hydnomerulius pinastri MD-312]
MSKLTPHQLALGQNAAPQCRQTTHQPSKLPLRDAVCPRRFPYVLLLQTFGQSTRHPRTNFSESIERLSIMSTFLARGDQEIQCWGEANLQVKGGQESAAAGRAGLKTTANKELMTLRQTGNECVFWWLMAQYKWIKEVLLQNESQLAIDNARALSVNWAQQQRLLGGCNDQAQRAVPLSFFSISYFFFFSFVYSVWGLFVIRMESSPSEVGELEFAFPSASASSLREGLEGSEAHFSDELVDGEWTKLYHQHSHHHQASSNHNHSPSSHHEEPSSRRGSPMPTSLRFSQQSTTQSHLHLQRENTPKSLLDSWLSRRSSVQSASTASHATNVNNVGLSHAHSLNSKLKGKERSLDSADSSSVGFGYGYGYGYDADNLVSTFSNPSASFTSYDSSPRSIPLQSQNNQPPPRKPRTSLLSAASDALGLRKKVGSASRKKPSPHYVPHTTHVMPDVIEISARNDTTVTTTVDGSTAHRDYEHEERERLRDAAAQSIGLDPDLLHDSRRAESLSSLDSPQGPPQVARIPPFPATLAALSTLTQMSATLPKFSPPSSLLVYALAKQWKLRTIVLTSHTASHKTHVHLFKSAAPDEREVERLEVTEESVIFVAEEDVGGRGSVVKLAGKDVGTKRNAGSGDESTRTMWFLQMTDPAESQRWIAAIKNAVLSQRSLRAGLGIPSQTNGGHEPRGDMDVMLSMHLQGIISSQPIKSPASTATPPMTPRGLTPPKSPSPPQSLRSLTISVPPSSPAAAIKGIFTGTRSRSPSIDAANSPTHPPAHPEDSFGAMGASLLTMLRTNATPDASSSPSHSLTLPLPHSQSQGSPAPSVRSASVPVVITASELKISKERDVSGLSSSPTSTSTCTPHTPSNPFHSPPGMLTLSLQPPPRKSKNASTHPPPAFSQEPQGMYKQADGNRSVAGSFGIQSTKSSDQHTPRATSPAPHVRSMSPGGAPRSISPGVGISAPSASGGLSRDGSITPGMRCVSPSVNFRSASPITRLRSVSPDTGANGSTRLSLAVPTVEPPSRSSSLSKRWSRQGVPLPKRLTPPSGPPPSVPGSPENTRRASLALYPHTPHPYAADRPPSPASSNSYSQTGLSPRSASSLSPTFWKRTSDSSAYSVSSASTSDSRALARLSAPVSGSLSSSLGSAVGVGGPTRAMSLSVPAASPVARKVSAKRRSMPPPRPAPSFAPPPAPSSEQGFVSGPTSPVASATPIQKSFRNSVAQRALRLSLTAPKPPPSSVLPPRPDEADAGQKHRRSSSSGNSASMSPSDLYPIPASPSRPTATLSRSSTPVQSSPAPSTRSLSIKQRLRILSAPSASSSPLLSSMFTPPTHVSTLDLDDDNENDPPITPSHVHVPSHQPFGLGEHITTMQNDPSFLQLPTPTTPNLPKPPPRSPFRPPPPSSNGLSAPPGPDRDFVALSPPPPRRASKQIAVMVAQPEKLESELPDFSDTGSVYPEENMLAALSARGSVVSLGFVAT